MNSIIRKNHLITKKSLINFDEVFYIAGISYLAYQNRTMKLKYILIISLLVLGTHLKLKAQEEAPTNSLPSIILKDLKGKTINTNEITNQGQALVLCFGKSTCKAAVSFLDEVAEDYEEWQEETNVVVYFISTNNARSSSKVAPFVNVREWEYKVLLDPNSEFKRAMNVVNCPHIYVIDGSGKISFQKTGYTSELKEEVYQAVINVTEKE